MRLTIQLSLMGAALLLAGCDMGQLVQNQNDESGQDAGADDATADADATDDNDSDADSDDPMMVRKVAEAGVGKKGRLKDRSIATKHITTPLNAYNLAKQRVKFIELQSAEQAYEIEHDFQKPPSHEVYMKEVVEKYQIKLPELPEGHRYVYDPEKAQLMVEHPADE